MILSRLRDTMYHTDVILHFRQVFDMVKSIIEMCSLWNFANAYILSTMCNFENYKLSHRRDSITQTWYFFLWKNNFWNKTLLRKCMNKKSSKKSTSRRYFFHCQNLAWNEVSRLCDTMYHADVIWPQLKSFTTWISFLKHFLLGIIRLKV